MSTRNQHVDLVQQGKFFVLEGARVELFKGCMKLTVQNGGDIKEAPAGTTFEVNKDLHMSKIEFDVISVEN